MAQTGKIEFENESEKFIPDDGEFKAKLLRALRDKEVRKAVSETLADSYRSETAIKGEILNALSRP